MMSPTLQFTSLAITGHFAIKRKNIDLFTFDNASKLPCPLLMTISAFLNVFKNRLEHKEIIVPGASEPEEIISAFLSIPVTRATFSPASMMIGFSFTV